MANSVVAICVPVGTRPSYKFWVDYEALQGHESSRRMSHRYLKTHALPIPLARTTLLDGALNFKDVTHILFIDDDMWFDPNSLERLLENDLDIVGGLCFNRRAPYQPILLRKNALSKVSEKGRYSFVYDYPKNALVEVDATGAGFLLFKREVAESVTKLVGAGHWFEHKFDEAEDVMFLERAKDCGHSIFVDTSCKITHEAIVGINEDTSERLRCGPKIREWFPESDDQIVSVEKL